MADDVKIMTMSGVREYAEAFPVDLVVDGDSGRLAVRALNEAGYNVTHVDLLDLLVWAETPEGREIIAAHKKAAPPNE